MCVLSLHQRSHPEALSLWSLEAWGSSAEEGGPLCSGCSSSSKAAAGAGVQAVWPQALSLPFMSSVTLSKSLNLSEPQLFHLLGKAKHSPYLPQREAVHIHKRRKPVWRIVNVQYRLIFFFCALLVRTSWSSFTHLEGTVLSTEGGRAAPPVEGRSGLGLRPPGPLSLRVSRARDVPLRSGLDGWGERKRRRKWVIIDDELPSAYFEPLSTGCGLALNRPPSELQQNDMGCQLSFIGIANMVT